MAFYHHTLITCPFCMHDTMVHTNHAETAESAVPDPIITPELRADIKKVKKAIAVKNKGIHAAKKRITQGFAAFKAQAAPLMASLTAMKREAMAAMKLTEEYREGVRAIRSANMLMTRFNKKYTLSLSMMRVLGLCRRRRSWYTPQRLLTRRFYIRL